MCAETTQPLVDFSPVDVGSGRSSMLVTVHNCSFAPVDLTEPRIWFGGWQMTAEYLVPDAEHTDLRPPALEPYSSAQVVLSWEGDGQAQLGETGVVSLDFPGIGQGEVRGVSDIGPESTAWLSGWTR